MHFECFLVERFQSLLVGCEIFKIKKDKINKFNETGLLIS